MDLAPHFSYQPTPTPPIPPQPPGPVPGPDLGPLAGLVGTWVGTGFNAIWRPTHAQGQDRFLELNLTSETLEFDVIPGQIPNRGFLQDDLLMTGLRYLQQISDANLQAGLHIEPGVWLSVPATTDPSVPASVARLGSIPHGTTIVVQGITKTASGPPAIPAINLNPFSIGNPAQASPFPEQSLATASQSRTSGPGLTNITQAMVDNPNSVLTSALQGQTVLSTTTLQVGSGDAPVPGGGTANTAFLQGGADGPNALAASVTATFWVETIQGTPNLNQLQYSQTVLLNFNGLSWPHVTVATLRRQP
jgi:hypothetical protein